MACACKTAKKIANKNSKIYKNESKGMKLTKHIIDWVIDLLNKIIIICLFVVITPIVILCLIFNLIFKGKLYIKLPNKMINKMKNSDKVGMKDLKVI